MTRFDVSFRVTDIDRCFGHDAHDVAGMQQLCRIWFPRRQGIATYRNGNSVCQRELFEYRLSQVRRFVGDHAPWARRAVETIDKLIQSRE